MLLYVQACSVTFAITINVRRIFSAFVVKFRRSRGAGGCAARGPVRAGEIRPGFSRHGYVELVAQAIVDAELANRGA